MMLYRDSLFLRCRQVFVALVIFVFAVLFLTESAAQSAAQSGGKSDSELPPIESHVESSDWRVIDGDTLEVGGARVRLLGIDTPELRQMCQTRSGADYPCGLMARDILVGVLDSEGSVWCAITGRDRYRRLLGRCFAGERGNLGGSARGSGVDIQHVLVRSGFAVAEYSGDYRQEEAKAKLDRLGMWRGSFLRPRDWRRQN